jgi:hypothetical protein
LYLDFDKTKPCTLRRVSHLLRLIGLRAQWVRYDGTRRGTHVVIRVNRRLLASEIVALQCLLGSDKRREEFNLARVMNGGGPKWNILFERKLK